MPSSHDDGVQCLVISPDSTRVATGSLDGTIILWNPSGHGVDEWVGHGTASIRSLAFSPDSRYLVSAGDEEPGSLYVWDLNQGAQEVATLSGHTGTIHTCAWSPDGALIASRSDDTTVRLWDAQTFQHLRTLQSSPWGLTNVLFLSLSADARWLAFGDPASHCCIWDVANARVHKVLRDRAGQPVRAVAFDAGSTRLATAYDDFSVRVWDIRAGKPLFVLRQQANYIADLMFSSNGLLLSASGDGTAKIWELCGGTLLTSLEGHSAEVNAACFSPCGRFVATASNDTTVRLWTTSDGSCVAVLTEHRSRIGHVAFSPDGSILSSAAEDGTVVIRNTCDFFALI